MGHPKTSQREQEAALQQRIAAYPFWYHTIELAPGVLTPGEWDLRDIVDRLPWPDVTGKRCLDVGTFNGFYAFELERRGAAEVVAVDVTRKEQLDWPRDVRPGIGDPGWDARFAGTDFELNGGFRIAAEALGSAVEWRECSIYDLDPDEVGTFDVIVCGDLLLHLRDPVRALEAVRSVCRGVFLSAEPIDLWLSIFWRGIATARFQGMGDIAQWWVPNSAGHQRMLRSAGFEVVKRSRPYVVPFGGDPAPPKKSIRSLVTRWTERIITGSANVGALHRAILARPSTIG